MRRVATRMECNSSKSSPCRVPASRSSIRAKWKRSTLRPASASESPATTPGVRPTRRRSMIWARSSGSTPSAGAVAVRGRRARLAAGWAFAARARRRTVFDGAGDAASGSTAAAGSCTGTGSAAAAIGSTLAIRAGSGSPTGASVAPASGCAAAGSVGFRRHGHRRRCLGSVHPRGWLDRSKGRPGDRLRGRRCRVPRPGGGRLCAVPARTPRTHAARLARRVEQLGGEGLLGIGPRASRPRCSPGSRRPPGACARSHRATPPPRRSRRRCHGPPPPPARRRGSGSPNPRCPAGRVRAAPDAG